ncbi:cupin domain-containing protein [Patulibacter sp.]|uniref:cupin domain-containing protein n=1 Tax=Patulibacter sp. TaxID=1912859 RepID=UPI00272676F4|nr:cupin domain-containing protein [Patulibacter sp.]MDO9408062.1 cupin domain-containing protein [Patulibacter sp.]
MSTPFTHLSLDDVEDVAPRFGFGERWQARAAREPLDMERTGAMLLRLPAGGRSPFTHRHVEAEEVYVVLEGSGRAKLEGEIVELARRDAVRVAPGTARAFEAGPDGLELLAFGARHAGDGEAVADPWTD